MIDTVDFQVIGESKANPDQLLLLGDDGQVYAFNLTSGETTPLLPGDAWARDLLAPPLLESPSDAAASPR
jgi:hypothetical protein